MYIISLHNNFRFSINSTRIWSLMAAQSETVQGEDSKQEANFSVKTGICLYIYCGMVLQEKQSRLLAADKGQVQQYCHLHIELK